MMSNQLVILGAGGHAKVVIEILKINKEYNIVGCLDHNQNRGSILDIPIIGNDTMLTNIFNNGVTNAFVAIGDNRIREKLVKKVTEIGFNIINVISNKSIIANSVSMGKGNVIMPGAILNTEAQLGNFTIINTAASIDHECIISDFVHIAPGCRLAGNIKVDKGVFLGINSSVIPEVRLGEWSIIGAGAVVLQDVSPYTKNVGVPAKVIDFIKYEG